MLSSSSRLLRLLSLLQTRSHWGGLELAERLAVHPRTLRRDIDRLRQLGYAIHASTGVAGGYAFRAGQALPPLLLDDEEAQAVAIALQTAAAGTVQGVEEGALRALVKLEQVMPLRLRRRVKALRAAILPLESLRPMVDAAALGSLALACRDQLRMAFAYRDGRGQASVREVEPQGLVHTDSRWYLVAWDPARDDWRTFRLDRIEGALTSGGHFKPRPGPAGGDLRAYVARSISTSSLSGEQARVVLHQPLAVMARRIPPAYATLEVLDEARCVMQCGTNHLESLAYWLLLLGEEFEVLEPSRLREMLRQAGERVARSLARVDASA
ncbi:MAG: helix-turn-helix transcriptional regulator [Hylemonella sp.]|uniref:helix-turn-helix transcriptional regulator n=1 Tax=Hylemonella sp. TaxID=2066020 RepID=UPI00391D2B43